MKKNLLVLFNFLAIFYFVNGQSKCDGEIAGMINNKKWFELNSYYPQCKDSLSDFMNLCATSLIDNFFNNPQGATESLGVFTDKYAPQLGAENISFVCMLAENCAKNKEYDKAVEIYTSLSEQLKDVMPVEMLTRFRSSCNKYKFYASIPPMEIVGGKPVKDIQVPFEIFEGGIFFDLKHKGQAYRSIFDTGASMNLVSDEYAEKMGLKPLADSVIFNNNLPVKMAIADTIRMGPVLFTNVPFAILGSSKKENPGSDTVKLPFEIVFGIEMMALLEEIHFDFGKKEMIIPKANGVFNGEKNMIYIDNLPYVNIKVNGNDLLTFYDSGYNGDFIVSSNANIELNKKEEAKEIKQRYLGAGGAMEMNLVELDNTKIRIGNQREFTLPVSYQGIIQNKNADGLIGKTFFETFNSLTINFKDMWIKYD